MKHTKGFHSGCVIHVQSMLMEDSTLTATVSISDKMFSAGTAFRLFFQSVHFYFLSYENIASVYREEHSSLNRRGLQAPSFYLHLCLYVNVIHSCYGCTSLL